MNICHNKGVRLAGVVPGGATIDVGGEITAESGKVLYRAEVLDTGHAESGKGTAVANTEPSP